MSETTLGVDFSVWQDDNSTPQMMDCYKARREGAVFAFVKASQNVRLDPDFVMNWQHTKDAGLVRGTYHFMDWSKPALDQARFYAGVLAADPGDMLVLDYECRTGIPSPGTARQAAHDFLVEIMRLTGKIPLLYTSPSFWAEHGSSDSWWAQFPLWIAHYYASKPKIPAPWINWTFWQYTDKGDGLRYGAESKQLDMNYFNGNAEALANFVSGQPFTPPDIPEQVYVVSASNIRNRPVIAESSDVGDLTQGAQLPVIGQEGDWWKVGLYVHKSVARP